MSADCTCDRASCDICWARVADRMWPEDAPHSVGPDPAGWGVFVNEVGINASRGGRDWWVTFAARYEPIGRIKVLDISVVGTHCHVACDSKDDAEQLRKQMLDNGIHKAHAQVKTFRACSETVRTRHAKRADHAEGCMYCRPEPEGDGNG